MIGVNRADASSRSVGVPLGSNQDRVRIWTDIKLLQLRVRHEGARRLGPTCASRAFDRSSPSMRIKSGRRSGQTKAGRLGRRWVTRQFRERKGGPCVSTVSIVCNPHWAPAGVSASQVDKLSSQLGYAGPQGCCPKSAPDPLSLTLLTVLTVFSSASSAALLGTRRGARARSTAVVANGK